MKFKLFAFGFCGGAAWLVSGAVCAAPLSLDARIGVGPKFMAHGDYSGLGYFNSALDLRLDGSSLIDENSRLDFEAGSERENLLSVARRSYAGLRFSQNMLKILDKDAFYAVEFANKGFRDYSESSRDFSENKLKFDGSYYFAENLRGDLGYSSISKAASFSDDSYKYGSFMLGGHLWFNNKKDVFDAVYSDSKKDSSTDARDFKNNGYSVAYKHHYDNFDSFGALIETGKLNYSQAAAGYSYDETKVEFGYSDYFDYGLRDIVFSRRNRGYSGDANADFEEYIFEHNINFAQTDTAGEKDSRHNLCLYNSVSGAGNDYISWSWDYTKFTLTQGVRGYYVSNEFTSQFWRNYHGSIKESGYFEDIIGAGIRWRSHKLGSFTMGPLAGWRVYNNPDSRTNSDGKDNTMLKNPDNFFLYGFKAFGSCSPMEKVDMHLNLDYKSFRDYNSRGGSLKNELLGFDFAVNYRLTENFKLKGSLEHRANLNRDSDKSALAHIYNCALNAEYLFRTIFTGAPDDKSGEM